MGSVRGPALHRTTTDGGGPRSSPAEPTGWLVGTVGFVCALGAIFIHGILVVPAIMFCVAGLALNSGARLAIAGLVVVGIVVAGILVMTFLPSAPPFAPAFVHDRFFKAVVPPPFHCVLHLDGYSRTHISKGYYFAGGSAGFLRFERKSAAPADEIKEELTKVITGNGWTLWDEKPHYLQGSGKGKERMDRRFWYLTHAYSEAKWGVPTERSAENDLVFKKYTPHSMWDYRLTVHVCGDGKTVSVYCDAIR